MRTAYGLLGLTFLFLFAGSYLLITRTSAPTGAPEVDPTSSYYENANLPRDMQLSSPAFKDNDTIPTRFSCDGESINPELVIEGVPQGTQSLVLLMDDPDLPDSIRENMGITVFDHWVLFNIPPDATVIAENSVPEGAVAGQNSAGGTEYRGPCPPDQEHRYFFKLFALDTLLDLESDATKADVERAMDGHIIESATLMGRYERPGK